MIPSTRLSGSILKHEFNIVRNLQSIFLKSTSVDVIDAFTKNLMENKILKWQLFHHTKLNNHKTVEEYDTNNLNANKNESKVEFNAYKNVMIRKSKTAENQQQLKNILLNPDKHEDIINFDLKEMDQQQLDEFFMIFLKRNHDDNNEKYLNSLMNKCIKWKLLPSYKILKDYLYVFSLKGDVKTVTDIQQELSETYNHEAKENRIKCIRNEIDCFKSIAFWKNGKTEMALEMLTNRYEKEYNEKFIYNHDADTVTDADVDVHACEQLLHWAFKEIIQDTLSKKSEAVLILLIKYGNLIYERCHDVYVISWIWKQCFSSEWYSDQKQAMRIFEKNHELRNLIYERSSSLCFHFLRENMVENVYRLIELYLKFEQKDACKNCLNQLFLYQYWRKDFRSCSEIIKTSKELNIKLNESQTNKLFNIIMNRSKGEYNYTKIPKTRRFEYKF